MSERAEKFLSVRDLCVEYTSDTSVVHAVNGVSFSMDKGETLAFVGETGAGKTTIAKAILGILPSPASRLKGGEIELEGEDLLEKTEDEMLDIRGNKIAMIFQDPMTALNPVKSIGTQIADCFLLHGYAKRADAWEKAREMLELVGIPVSRIDEYPFEFSGGMKQRVVIAMALACNPDLILADEPTTALDVTIQAQVLDLINDLKEKYKTSMILITHDLGIVAQTSDSVAIVYAGSIVERGDKMSIFLNPSHPYTKGLFSSLPNMNKGSKRLKPIEGMLPDPTDLPPGCAFHPRCPRAVEACRSGEIPVVEISAGHLCRCCNIE